MLHSSCRRVLRAPATDAQVRYMRQAQRPENLYPSSSRVVRMEVTTLQRSCVRALTLDFFFCTVLKSRTVS
jgi:hypothetical protein